MKSKKLKIHNLKVIKNFKGDIKKYLDFKIIKKFKISEIYFSEIKKNQIKGWNLHMKATCFLSVAYGSVKFQIKNKNFKLIKNILINKKNHKCIEIPPGMWFSFKAVGRDSVVINSINLKHQINETRKKPI